MSMDEETLVENRSSAGDLPLKGRRVAILATDGFQPAELAEPRRALDDAGATTHVVAPHSGTIRSTAREGGGREVDVDQTLAEADPEDYDALFLPGGKVNGETLRHVAGAARFARAFFDAEKPVGAICHGPLLLVEANVLKGRRMTSWPQLADEMRAAGAQWEDSSVVADRGLVTSRKPEDIPEFSARMLQEFASNTVAARTDRTLEV